MFHLWIGVMAGLLLAYLWARPQPPRRRPTSASKRQRTQAPITKKWWRSERWWLAGLVLAVLFIPLLWDLGRTGYGFLGPIEAIKTILLPWAAGVGFGIWMYFIAVVPLARDTRKASPSFVPIAVAMLFVTLIVSEERYGWFARLQKITIGGSGLEFSAPLPAASQITDRSSLPTLTGVSRTGVGRIGELLDFMSGLKKTIERDRDYAIETGLAKPDEKRFKNDIDFAGAVVTPLGERLSSIHAARAYNSIEFLIERRFVDDFRAFVQSHRDSAGPPATGRGSLKTIRDGVQAIWDQACELDKDLQRLHEVEPPDASKPKPPDCREESKTATAFLDPDAKRDPPGLFKPDLPYGTLLAALLLSAAGEVDSAVSEIDKWNARNASKAGEDAYKRFAVYRALFQAAHLPTLISQPGATTYPAILQLRRVVALGDEILSHNGAGPGKIPWRVQLRRFERGDRIDPIWLVGVCSHDLSTLFKRFLLAHLAASNNFAYLLSGDVQFAKHQGLVDEMAKRGDYLANKVSARCLQDQIAQATRVQASYLDTAAAVEYALASTEQGRAEKRVRLCKALIYAKKAVGFYEETGLSRRSSTLGAAASGKMPSWSLAERQRADTESLEAIEFWALFSGRLERIQTRLADAGLDCQA